MEAAAIKIDEADLEEAFEEMVDGFINAQKFFKDFITVLTRRRVSRHVGGGRRGVPRKGVRTRGRPEMDKDKEAVTPDPVFAAIDVHREASDAWMAAAGLADKGAAKEKGRTVTPADVEASERAVRLERKAMAGLIPAMPWNGSWPGLPACVDLLRRVGWRPNVRRHERRPPGVASLATV